MMPPDGAMSGLAPAAETEQDAARHNRPSVVAFVNDAETEAALREGLAEAAPEGIDLRRASVRAAIAALSHMPSPRTLIIDVSREEHPLVALDDLAHVVEPDARVLVIGDREDVNFYRQVTRGLGVLDYLYKPLMRDMVARHFGPLLGQRGPAPLTHGGRVITVTGARGGVGATTVAANLAWHLGAESSRHTVLVDSDLHRGNCALLLGAKTGHGLRTALETPARIDELFVERSAQPAGERLHVLASEEKLTEQPNAVPGAATRLVAALCRRYNFVILDVPFSGHAFHREMLDLAHQRIAVAEPTLAAMRDTLRLLGLPNGPAQPRRSIVLLNRAGRRGGLTNKQVAEALKMAPDVMIPDLPRVVEGAATLGEPAIRARGPFRTSMLQLAREVGFMHRESAEPVRTRSRFSLFGRRS